MISRRNFLIACGSLTQAWCMEQTLHAAVVKRVLPRVDLGFVSQKLKLFNREDWTKTKVKTWMLRGAGEFDRVTVHHAGQFNIHKAKTDVVNDLESILISHASQGYADIAYHFVIDRAGSLWEGRSLAYEGAHVAEQNENNLGIMLLGNFEEQEPSECQLESMYQLIRILRGHYGIKRHRIYGHRDLGSTLCPGEKLYKYVAELSGRRVEEEEKEGVYVIGD